MEKKRFAIVGAGFRSEYFQRVAAACPEEFELAAILTRDAAKCAAVRERAITVYTSVRQSDPQAETDSWCSRLVVSDDPEDIEAVQPDFIVVSVTKPVMNSISEAWRSKGYVVICETPAAQTVEELRKSYETRHIGGRLLVAEQYMYYPTYRKLIALIESGIIGTPVAANVSLAHQYHGFSLMRKLLNVSPKQGFRIETRSYQLPVTRTHDRYQLFTDGEIVTKPRDQATVTFDDGKLGFYDFDSEQYRSMIRFNTFRVSGTRGEIINEKCWYLDEHNMPHTMQLSEDIQIVKADTKEDETAVKEIMRLAGQVQQALKDEMLRLAAGDSGEASAKRTPDAGNAAGRPLLSKAECEEIFRRQEDNLVNALQDAYMTVLQEDPRPVIDSEPQPWQAF